MSNQTGNPTLLSKIKKYVSVEYRNYFTELATTYYNYMTVASAAHTRNIDPSNTPEVIQSFGSKDRFLSTIGNKAILDDITSHHNQSRYITALLIGRNFLLGKYGFADPIINANKGLDAALTYIAKASYSLSTPAINLKTQSHPDNSYHLSLVITPNTFRLNPTHAFFSLLFAEETRKHLGFQRAPPVEGLNFRRYVEGYQEKATVVQSIKQTLQSLPVEIICDLQSTPQPRPGTSHNITNDLITKFIFSIVILRNKANSKLINKLGISGWEWLQALPDTYKSSRPHPQHSTPQISSKLPGSFRFILGRAPNTGFGTAGFHPTAFEVLDNLLVTGTQVKIDSLVTVRALPVDSIEPPIVKLHNGTVLALESNKKAREVKNQITKILSYGDILISAEDLPASEEFLEGYTIEHWADQLKSTRASTNIQDIPSVDKLLTDPFHTTPSFEEALEISRRLDIPMHPHYTYSWELITLRDLIDLKTETIFNSAHPSEIRFSNTPRTKSILEKLLLPHTIEDNIIIAENDHTKAISYILSSIHTDDVKTFTSMHDLITAQTGIQFKQKTETNVQVTIAGPEISTNRSLQPPAHSIFPVGRTSYSRDIIVACNTITKTELPKYLCKQCKATTPYPVCSTCRTTSTQLFHCPYCATSSDTTQCKKCGRAAVRFDATPINLQQILNSAIEEAQIRPYAPLRGIDKARGPQRKVERLEKGILRQRHNLFVFKDGTIRFSITNAPLTHFTPKMIGTDPATLRQLGYTSDVNGNQTIDENSLLVLRPQDVVIPYTAADYLRRTADFIDETLKKLYKIRPFYDFKNLNDLIGHLIVGISPATSIGLIGRIIGFVDASVCYAHPAWHAAKEHNASADDITLFMDVLLNFSPQFLSYQNGDFFGAPILLVPILDPDDSIVITRRKPTDVIDQPRRARLKMEDFFFTCDFTYPTSVLSTSHAKSSYFDLSLKERIQTQLSIIDKATCIDADRAANEILQNAAGRIVLDLIQQYTTQRFKCKNCGETYRRPTMKGLCLTCEKQLQPTMSSETIESLVTLGNSIASRYKLSRDTQEQLTLASESFDLLKHGKKQTTLVDYA